MNVLIQDLIATAGTVAESALNALPEPSRQAVATAMEGGGWVEVRVGVMNSAACVLVMLTNLDGHATELARVDHKAH